MYKSWERGVNTNCMYKSWEGVLHLTYLLWSVTSVSLRLVILWPLPTKQDLANHFKILNTAAPRKQNFFFYGFLCIVTYLTLCFVTFVMLNIFTQPWWRIKYVSGMRKVSAALVTTRNSHPGTVLPQNVQCTLYTVKKERVTYVEQGAKSYGRHGILKFV